jgi:GrpB-like predicted nucleotidyltransferase (UPF0157 family)
MARMEKEMPTIRTRQAFFDTIRRVQVQNADADPDDVMRDVQAMRQEATRQEADWSPLGTQGRQIEIVPYDPAWPRLFEEEAGRILRACAGIVEVVEHIGSTAVAGLPAKPILDIMPGLRTFEEGLQTVAPLQALGYGYYGERGMAGRHHFDLRMAGRCVVHVHMFVIGTEDWCRHLVFRDALRAHADLAAQYAALKQSLAVRFRDDREAYTRAKGEFIHTVVCMAAGKEPSL